MNQLTSTDPLPRRDVFLTVALMVARDGLPEPESLRLYNFDRPLVCVAVGSQAELEEWARVLNARVVSHFNPDHTRAFLDVRCHDHPSGWEWNVSVTEPIVTSVEPGPLALEVIAAIEASANDRPLATIANARIAEATPIGAPASIVGASDRGSDR